MRKPFFNIEEKSKTEVNIMIFGIIGYDNSYWNDGTNNEAFAFVKKFKALEKKYERINIHINSPGGYVDDGLAMFNTIKNSKKEIHTYNNGLTASMASVIMLAGQYRHFPTTSLFHLHSASTIAFGNSKEFENTIKELNQFDNVLIKAISEQSGVNIKDIKADWFNGDDHYFTGEEALQLGFATEIDETQTDVPVGIQNLKYSKLLNLYQTNNKSDDNSMFNKFKKALNITKKTNNNNPININTMNHKILAAILLLDALNIEDGKIVLHQAQANKLENEVERLQIIEAKYHQNKIASEALAETQKVADAKIVELNATIATMTTKATAKDTTITELTAKLEKKPAAKPNTVTDNSGANNNADGVDWELINNLPHNKDYDKFH
jgi:ATP-dependent protease ClpP protease subunit